MYQTLKIASVFGASEKQFLQGAYNDDPLRKPEGPIVAIVMIWDQYVS